MAAERKLKGEIDRTLKKVQEGQELFEELWVQVHECDNSNQREKLEGELKKEIKKLQRLREQIKAWIAGADIKDKQPLMDARKSIERDMERFKICEREMKMAGRAGTVRASDPKEKAKDDARDWINTSVESLTAKVEESEYEMEELQGSVKKKQKPPPRLTELEELVARHKEHIARLEKVLRCIDNETIQPDELENLKADMESYLSGEGEEQGMDFSNVDVMYEDLLDRLDAVDQAAPAAMAMASGHGKHSKQAKDKEEAEKEREREKENERQRAAAAAAKAQLIAQGNNNIRLNDEEEAGRKPAPAGPAAKAGTAAALPAQPPPPPPPPAAAGQPAAAAATTARGAPTPTKEPPADGAAAAAPGTATPGGAPSTPRSMSINSDGLNLSTPTAAARGAAPGFAQPAGAPPAGAAAAAAGARGPAAGPAPAAAAPAGSNWLNATTGGSQGGADGAAAAGAAARGANFVQKLQQGAAALGAPPGMAGPAPGAATAAAVAGKGSMGKPAGSKTDSLGAAEEAGLVLESPLLGVDGLVAAAKGLSLGEADGARGGAGAGPSGAPEPLNLAPAVPVFSSQAAKQILESCYMRALPQPSDTEWKRYRPRHPVAVPPSYPRSPHEVIDNPALFRKVDPECLFFAFYFQPDSYQQFLAAHELKRQSWRFHKHHNAWFQRFTEPTVTSEEYEQGAYVYFDYNIVHDDLQTGWCYRRKEAFTFRYDALEDELRGAPPS